MTNTWTQAEIGACIQAEINALMAERDEALTILRGIVDGAREGDTDMLETAIDHARRMLARV